MVSPILGGLEHAAESSHGDESQVGSRASSSAEWEQDIINHYQGAGEGSQSSTRASDAGPAYSEPSNALADQPHGNEADDHPAQAPALHVPGAFPNGANVGPHAPSTAEQHNPHLFDFENVENDVVVHGTAAIDPHHGGAGLDDADDEEMQMAGHADDETGPKPPSSTGITAGSLVGGLGGGGIAFAHSASPAALGLGVAGGQAAGGLGTLLHAHLSGAAVEPHHVATVAAQGLFNVSAAAAGRGNYSHLVLSTAASLGSGRILENVLEHHKEGVNSFINAAPGRASATANQVGSAVGNAATQVSTRIGSLFHREPTPESQSEV